MAVINGSGRMDVLFGTFGDDVLNGRGGNDWMFGSIGSDTLNGGSGHDRLSGNSGDDTLNGGYGVDLLFGGSGNDNLYGGHGNDRMFGGSGDDLMYGEAGNDRMVGGFGNDLINGGSGNDLGVGGSGDDRMYGGSGDDRMYGGSGDDRIEGGSGNDLGVGGSGNDVLDGGSGTDRMHGGSGEDVFLHVAEENTAWRDYYSGGGGNDTLVLTLNAEEAVDADIQADITAFETFLETGSNRWFKFDSLKLWVRDIEDLQVIRPEPEPEPEPVNTAPIVSGVVDLGASDEDTTVTFTASDLLATTTDAEGDALTVSDVTVSTGRVELVGGAYVYTPDANEHGSVTFTYSVSDGAETVSASATLEVSAVNDAPVAVDDAYTVTEGGVLSLSLLANDTDIDGDTVSLVSVDPRGLTGDLVVGENGELTYTADIESLAEGETLTDIFTYVVTDGEINDVGIVAVTVEGTNDGPVALDDGLTVEEGIIVGDAQVEGVNSVKVDDTISLDVLANDSDIDTSDTLQIVSINASDDLLARANISIVGTGADQQILFDADEDVFFPQANAGPGGPPPDGAILVGDGPMGGPIGGPIGGGFPIREDLVTFEYTVSDGTEEATATVSLYVYEPGMDIIY